MPISQIALANSNSADNFAAVNRDLGTCTLAFSANNDVDEGDGGPKGMGPMGYLVVPQRKLLDQKECDRLFRRCRQALPGFDVLLFSDAPAQRSGADPCGIIGHARTPPFDSRSFLCDPIFYVLPGQRYPGRSLPLERSAASDPMHLGQAIVNAILKRKTRKMCLMLR